jgi:hypothetical protein
MTNTIERSKAAKARRRGAFLVHSSRRTGLRNLVPRIPAASSRHSILVFCSSPSQRVTYLLRIVSYQSIETLALRVPCGTATAKDATAAIKVEPRLLAITIVVTIFKPL